MPVLKIRLPLALLSGTHNHSRKFSTTRHQLANDFTHTIIGAGVIGLSIARALQSHSPSLLIEKHTSIGTETSSRNSEVIHAGLYYGPDSLKTRLCIRGREQLYNLCNERGIPYRKTGKWIVAQTNEEYKQLEKIHAFAKSQGVPTRWVAKQEAQDREPDVRAEAGVLESPETGIVDSHSYMTYLLGDFEERGGTTALDTSVSRIVPKSKSNGEDGWEIYTTTTSSEEREESCITTDTVINAAGLYAVPIANMILPADKQLIPHYAKGTYWSYTTSHPRPKTLIYPAPIPGHAGLGTHLTLDLSGRVRFGPDVQPTDSPTDYTPSNEHLEAALREITAYLPGIDKEAVVMDYCGIRPKLARGSAVLVGKGFTDFVIRREEGVSGWVNLLGIESPGLTASLAIGEMVEDLLYK